ncbi:uncharacterized protein wu:fi75a02 [Pristis pectinata]|uniref:uncharacterized protein wu:fi75a02 n=1 Tax=Pristis pectinata TaxID=685728 RepID=UPI00223E0F1D|nr:uncharacterized protein wu:fi75a02 [Pristis pectinata]
MLSAIVGGSVTRGQQLPTTEAASFLLAQGLCIRLRSRRVTRVPVPNRPSQPQAVPPPHKHGEQDGQMSVSEAASHLLTQELQCKRVTRTSIQSQPPDPAPAPHTRTHNLKSSGRTVRKLNYRKVANLGLVASPNIGNKRRNAKPRKSELPAAGDGEEKSEARANRKKQASGKLSQEVELEQRKGAGAVGKSHSVGRQSKPHSVVNPGSNQADGEVGPETWSSAISESVTLKAEIPQVHIQPCVNPAGLSGEDDSNCRTTPSISERAEGRSVMDNCKGGVPANVHRETQSDSPLCSTEHLFTASANEMCTESGTSSDASEETACPKIPQREAPAMPVGVEKARRVSGESKSTGEALKGIVVPLPAAASEKHLGIDSVHKVPLRGIVTSDVPDWMPSAAIATNHLLTGNVVTDKVLACSAATIRTLAHNGLPPSKAPVEGGVTDDAFAECGSRSGVLGGETVGQRGTCANVGRGQLADRSVDAAPSGLTTEGEVAKIVLLGVATTNGTAKSALIEASSGQTEALGDVVTSAMPIEDVRANEMPAGNLVVPGPLAGVETTAECTTFELPTQDKLTNVPTITVPTHLATEDVIKPVPLGVVAARCILPKSAVSKLSPDVTVEGGIPSESPKGEALTSDQLGESNAATDAVMEVSAGVELTMGVFYDVATDGELMENELADIPTDVTGIAMEMYTAGDPAMEGSVAVNEAHGGGLLPGSVREAAEPAGEGEDVMYEVLADGELVDIPTDVINDLTEEEADYKAEPLGVASTSGENGLFALYLDSITNKMSGSAKAVNSWGMTSSWVFSGNELLQLSPGSSALLEDEKVGVVPAEGVVSSNFTEEKPLHGTEGLVAAGLTDAVGSELRAARNPLGKGVQGMAETQVSEFCSAQTFPNEEFKTLTSKGQDVCTCSESDASRCEDKYLRAVEPSECETETVPSPVTNPVPVKCLEQKVRSVVDIRNQQILEEKTAPGGSVTVLVNEAAAICSAKKDGFRCRNKRKGFVRLKLRKLNSTVHFLNCTPSLPQLEKFCLNRTSACMEFCKRRNNCISSDLDHRVQHVEEIKPKNLSLLPLNDLAHHKLCKKPPLLEHLSAIARGLRVLSNCTEILQEFTAPSKLVSVGVYRRLQTKRIEDLQFCFGSQQATSWDVLCHLLTPRKDQPIDARVCRKVQPWLSSRYCKQSLQFGCPVPSNLDLILLLSFISDGARFDQHCASERTNLSIIPQHWSQDSQALSQCQTICGHALRPPASLVRAGRCRCPCSRFGLHTVLALSSPACYRLWTRQRHFGRLSNTQRPLLTLFEEGAKRLIPPVPSGKPVSPPSCNLPGLVPWCSQHVPSPCTSTSNISPSNSWRHGCLANSPSYLPPCLLTGNGASVSEAKSLLLQQTSKRSHLQHLSFACIVEPFLALPDPPTSSAECTVADAFPATSSPIPSITYAETQLHTEQKEDRASPNKPVSKSKESLRKVSQIRIRKTIPKQDTNLTPMGLPKPKRLKKKEFSLEEIYTNQNYKSPSAHSKYLETIFEEPVLKKGSFVCTSLQKRKRLLEFQDYTLPRKRRTHAGVKVPSRTRGRKASTREEEVDSLLVQKLTELEAFLAGEDEGL